MELHIAEQIARSQLNSHNLPNWTFHFNSRRSGFGVCNSRRKTIGLSSILTYLNEEKVVLETILHEIAHAIDSENRGYSNHDYHWENIARRIGSNGERCYKMSEVNVPIGRYLYECIHCGKQSNAERLSKRNKACGVCCNKYNGGRYSEKYLMKQVTMITEEV